MVWWALCGVSGATRSPMSPPPSHHLVAGAFDDEILGAGYGRINCKSNHRTALQLLQNSTSLPPRGALSPNKRPPLPSVAPRSLSAPAWSAPAWSFLWGLSCSPPHPKAQRMPRLHRVLVAAALCPREIEAFGVDSFLPCWPPPHSCVEMQLHQVDDAAPSLAWLWRDPSTAPQASRGLQAQAHPSLAHDGATHTLPLPPPPPPPPLSAPLLGTCTQPPLPPVPPILLSHAHNARAPNTIFGQA